MHIVRREHPDKVVVLELHGKILIGEGDDALRDAVQQETNFGTRRVVVDFQDVPYVDSVGLGEITRCFAILARKGGRLVLARVSRKFKDLLAITKLLTVFEIYETVEEALAARPYPHQPSF